MRRVLGCGAVLGIFWVAAAGAWAQSLPAQAPGQVPASRPVEASASGLAATSQAVEAVAFPPAGLAAAAHMDLTQARILPVGSGGRILPVDTLARQVVRRVTGQRAWGDADPVATLLSWTWFAPRYRDEPIILVDSLDLRSELGLPDGQTHFSYVSLSTNPALLKILEDIRREKEHPAGQWLPKWTPIQQAAMATWHRVGLLKAVFDDQLLCFIPPAENAGGPWVSIANLDSRADVSADTQGQVRKDWDRMRTAFAVGDRQAFAAAGREMAGVLEGLKSPAWPNRRVLIFEALYNMIQPFKAGWIVTGLALGFGLLAAVRPNRWIKAAAWGLLLDGLVVLTVGIGARQWFTGHLPVTTMYESLVLLAWGVTAIGIAAMLLVRQRATLPVVAALATAVLLVVDMAPLNSEVAVLDAAAGNPAWLTGGLLAVMLAFGALALGMGLGHVQAASLALAPARREWAESLDRLLGNMLWAGCGLLAVGLVAGAVWTGQSQGRLLGWGLQQTGCLGMLLVYGGVLQARRSGWFGAFGLAVASILCFPLVVIVWWVVPFQVRLEPGFRDDPAPGILWLGLFAAAEVLFVLATRSVRGRRWTIHKSTQIEEQDVVRP